MKKRKEKGHVLALIGIIFGLVSMMLFNHFSYYFSTVAKMKNMGMGNLTEITILMEKYLSNNMEVVQSTAITLEYMLDNNASTEEVESFLNYKSEKYLEENAGDFTGIYGLINDTYVDGSGWIPAESYVPSKRSWYVEAKEAQGETVLVSPYLDAKTGTILLSVSKLLSDGDSVVAVDIELDEIQHIIESAARNKTGDIFVVDKSGFIISHSNAGKIGQNYFDDVQMQGVLNGILSGEEPYFEAEVNEEICQVYSQQIMGDLYVAIVVNKELFFSDVSRSFVSNIFICGIISVLIISIYVYSVRMMHKSFKIERESNEKIEQANMNLIRALVRTIDAKDRYTNGHSIRVAEYAMKIAERMGKSQEEQKTVYYAGLLHDVGKIRVPEEIINKPGRLTDEEFEQIKIHPGSGYHILKDIYEDKTIAMGVKYHHERYDGKGYPSGLAGENIPKMARILGVADAYDAMASNRSYRNALPQEKIREEIEKGKGTQFDSQIADIMLQMIDEDKEYRLKQNESLKKTILVVDDDPMNIKIIEHIMKDELRYDIVSVLSGKEALKVLDEISVQLILLDLEMPEMNGFETLLQIRKKHNIPVAFMSGNKDIDTIQKATKMGVDEYIVKPFSPLAFREIIHGMLNEY